MELLQMNPKYDLLALPSSLLPVFSVLSGKFPATPRQSLQLAEE